jgi:multidrug resistance efflux pump
MSITRNGLVHGDRAGYAATRLPAWELVQTSKVVQRLGQLLLLSMLTVAVLMMFVPWQQSSRGAGRVTAFVPQERQQPVMSPIKGIVSEIKSNLREGDVVRQGEVILTLQPVAADMVELISFQVSDLRAKLDSAQTKVEVYRRNVADFGDARDFAVRAAQEMLESSEAKLAAKKTLVPGYQAKELQARLNYERQSELFARGATAEKELEKLKRDWDVAVADRAAAEYEVSSADREVAAKRHELEQKRSEAQTKIDYAKAMEQDAVGQQATVQKEIRELEIKLSELQQLKITAPRDGIIYRLPVFERGQSIKEGDPLFTIVPTTDERAVELWVSGNDISLIRIGDHVRLQFEGWPAIQFAGWPSVAVGTFGGRVAKIDPTDDGQGKFRIQVLPEGTDEWPGPEYLRQGVRANGWVMLRRVTLGYEIWRQLNGFPPVIAEGAKSEEKAKKINLPK